MTEFFIGPSHIAHPCETVGILTHVKLKFPQSTSNIRDPIAV